MVHFASIDFPLEIRVEQKETSRQCQGFVENPIKIPKNTDPQNRYPNPDDLLILPSAATWKLAIGVLTHQTMVHFASIDFPLGYSC